MLQFLGVVFAIVYMGDHYVVDAVVGVAYALLAAFLVNLGLRADERPAQADAAVRSLPARPVGVPAPATGPAGGGRAAR